MGKKIDIIKTGKNLKELLVNVIKYTDVTLVAPPNKNEEMFIIDFEQYKNEFGRVDIGVMDLEEQSGDLEDYIIIRRNEYEQYLRFKKKNTRLVKIEDRESIKEEYQAGASQRSLAKKFGVSVATVNKILNGKY
ncbi:hypothetical protein [Cetobacterium sp.]|uniref:hypothetical protein n=1 Tax=Cetobacterium sp. TaxID=2071632 RepID=UPI003EE71555